MSSGCVYASAERGVRIRSGRGYAPGCVYTRVGAFTRAVGAVRIRSGCIYAPGCVYAGRCVYASGGCVYTGGALLRTPSRIHRFLRIRTPDRVYAGIDEP